MLIVKKYGGSSVATPERVRNVANQIIADVKAGHQIVVVLSAQGKTTDQLIAKAKELNPNPSKREMDMLISTGEQQSVALMAITLQGMGYQAVSLNAFQVPMHTNKAYGNARLKAIDTERMEAELDRGNVVLVTGFQGINRYEDVTTLGRGGSDTTAVALAAALKADRCQIYTDVEGVYTADPRKIPGAVKLEEITYDEMLELATSGAQVLNNRSVEMAKKYNVELEVRSSIKPVPGTKVKEVTKVEKMLIKGVAKDNDVARVAVIGLPDHPGIAFKVFSRIAKAHICVDNILQSVGRDGTKDIAFTVPAANGQEAVEALREYCDMMGAKDLVCDTNVAKISVVGAGMETHEGVAADMFEALAVANINIEMITSSEIRVSVLVDKKDADRAVEAVHRHFFDE